MPRQGQSVESCIITRWFKKKGDFVHIGELLFSYETDKASFEEASKVEGTILEIFYNEGEEVPVLSNVAVIGVQGEKIESFIPDSIENLDENKSTNSNQKSDNYILVSGIQHPDSVKISPLAKKKAIQLGIDYKLIKGTGPGGRIINRNIRNAVNISSSSKSQLELDNTSNAASNEIPEYNITDSSGYKEIKLSNIRKIIAKAMFNSLQNSAQLTHHMSADVRRLLEIRNKIKANLNLENSINITLNDMICFAVIRALKKHPDINGHFLGESIRIFNKVHLGFAVDTSRGLMVPVLRNADDFSLEELLKQLKELADSCRNSTVNPDLLQSTNASFTISNLGSYGVEMFTPIINLPQIAILGVNTIVNRPAELGNGVFGFVPFIGLSLTYDHRAIDGGPASLFLKEIKNEVENFNF